ncbi:hypothetical protein [Paraburkholderia tropica]|uniref:hypothetical protein n=1 Tax=Paraburkholderia tropica TaxID=92647 RepID=UPI0007ECE4DC|nr:hypothetical protein [Paraburkholderia tropica]
MKNGKGARPAAPAGDETPLSIVIRVILGVAGSYLAADLATIAIARASASDGPVSPGPFIGFLIYPAIAIWVFAVRRLRIAASGVAVSCGLLAALVWFVAQRHA